MVDEESQDVASEPAAGEPIDRNPQAEPDRIEGQVSSQERLETAPSQESQSRQDMPRPAIRGASSGTRAFFSGALGGLVLSTLVGVGGYFLLAPKVDVAEADAGRLAALESQAQRESEALSALEKRVAALQQGTNSETALSALEKRVSALESSDAASGMELDKRIGAIQAADASNASSTQAVQSVVGEVKELRADVDAARGEIPGLSARVAKLESGAPQQAAAAADLSALASRLEKLEAQLAAPKSETRVAPDKHSVSNDSAAVALVAEALRDKLSRGAPFPSELAALESLGVDPKKLMALKAAANGAPTDRALADDFAAVQPQVLDAAAPRDHGGLVDRFLTHLRGLVQVRNLNETAGDDPSALVSRIEADSRRGDLSGALAAFAKLPQPSREAASSWESQARARQAAEAALQSIREEAVARLAESGKP